MTEALDRVLTAWRLTPASFELRAPPAGDGAIAGAERALGRPLPRALKALYGFGNGISALGGNLGIVPLFDEDADGLVDFGTSLRSWSWPIPDQVLAFGGNGADEQFGVWYPPESPPDGPIPVVMIGAVFEPACLALAGTDFERFLQAWSGYYLVLLEAPSEALDALGLPDALRRIPAEGGMAPYFRWADPSLPDPNPDPYSRGMDAEGIASVIKRLQDSGESGGH